MWLISRPAAHSLGNQGGAKSHRPQKLVRKSWNNEKGISCAQQKRLSFFPCCWGFYTAEMSMWFWVYASLQSFKFSCSARIPSPKTTHSSLWFWRWSRPFPKGGRDVFWANFSDLSRGHPKWWFSKGILPKSPWLRFRMFSYLPRSFSPPGLRAYWTQCNQVAQRSRTLGCIPKFSSTTWIVFGQNTKHRSRWGGWAMKQTAHTQDSVTSEFTVWLRSWLHVTTTR